jgi:hypothetical protein
MTLGAPTLSSPGGGGKTKRIRFDRLQPLALLGEFVPLRLEHRGQLSDSFFETLFHFFTWAADGLDAFRRAAGAWLATSFPNPPRGCFRTGACAAGF